MKESLVHYMSAYVLVLLSFFAWPGHGVAEEVLVPEVAQRIAAGHPTRIVCFGDSITGIIMDVVDKDNRMLEFQMSTEGSLLGNIMTPTITQDGINTTYDNKMLMTFNGVY